MKEICASCGLEWIISTRTKIPESGYECPYCESKRLCGIPITRKVERKERTSNASSVKQSIK